MKTTLKLILAANLTAIPAQSQELVRYQPPSQEYKLIRSIAEDILSNGDSTKYMPWLSDIKDPDYTERISTHFKRDYTSEDDTLSVKLEDNDQNNALSAGDKIFVGRLEQGVPDYSRNPSYLVESNGIVVRPSEAGTKLIYVVSSLNMDKKEKDHLLKEAMRRSVQVANRDSDRQIRRLKNLHQKR